MWVARNAWLLQSWGTHQALGGNLGDADVLQVGQSQTMGNGGTQVPKLPHRRIPDSPAHSSDTQGLGWLVAGSVLKPRLLFSQLNSYSVTWRIRKWRRSLVSCYIHVAYSRNRTSCLCLNSVTLLSTWLAFLPPVTGLLPWPPPNTLTSTHLPSKYHLRSPLSLDKAPL